MGKERRKFERYPMKVAARIGSENRPGVMRDISARGIAVVTDMALEKEWKVRLHFESKDGPSDFVGTIKVKLETGKNFTYGIAFLQKYVEQTTKLVNKRENLQMLHMKKIS